jgi:peptidoglycan-associated lipoprotein
MIVFLLFIFFIGCSKKSTKVDTSPQDILSETSMKQPEGGDKDQAEGIGMQSDEVKEVPITKSKPPFKLNNVYFDYDKYNVKSDMFEVLSQNAKVLQAYPEVSITIEGHCDERGTIEYNLALGERRAYSIKNYLVNYGIDPNRLLTISYGEERPTSFGDNESAWAQNRRVEFVIPQR